MSKLLFGFLGGVIGGALVDLLFINLAGPSALFSILGITGRLGVLVGHLLLGGMLGVLFVVFAGRFSQINIWFLGFAWGMACLLLIGAVPAFFAGLIEIKTAIFGFAVWSIFGLVLSGTAKISQRL